FSSTFMNSGSQIPMLNGDNFSNWKDQVLLTLGCMDLDLVFRVDEPAIPTDSSTPTEKASYKQWERSNRLSLMLIKKHISKGIRGSIRECTKVKDFLKAIEDQYVRSDKALASTLMKRLSDMKYNGSGSVREHIMQMRDIAAQLKPLEVDISEPFLVHLILNSLPKEYGPFKITYNAQKEKWSVNELLTMCVQEEERLKNENIEVANLMTQNKGKGKNGKFGPYEKKAGNMSNEFFGNKFTRFFCRKTGHKKKDCPKYKKWLEKKGNFISCVCYESNFVKVLDNTWWIDSGSTINIANTMQGFLSLRKPMGSEQSIYSGNKMRSQVEAVGIFRLVFKNGYVLNLEATFYVPSFSRNLASIAKLVPLGYVFNFSKLNFSVMKNNVIVGGGYLDNGLYKFDLDSNFISTHLTLENGIGTKRCVIKENSSMLWHKRLGHISIERLKRLTTDGILKDLDFSNFGTCVDCINEKQTNKSNKGVKRSSTVLELIHIDICGSFPPCFNGQRYFVSFIDDFSRYMYLYLIFDKAKAFDDFKAYKVEVEKQLEKSIKIVRSNRGGEYYGWYTENEQNPGPFATFLKEEGIIAQYTMPGTPQQNGVAERPNRTLMDMVTTIYNRDQSNQEQSLTKENENAEPFTLNDQNSDENVEVRKSSRVKKSAISSNSIVYFQEFDFDIGPENDPTSFSQAMSSENSNLWHDAMKEKIASMAKNQV
ncbi:UNVERIFIED_CONTAM: Retrovirus-related Pol polyprotein from transposon TNT 1-94, partial [Sesamum radiatum]